MPNCLRCHSLIDEGWLNCPQCGAFMALPDDEEVELELDDPPVQHSLASGTLPTPKVLTIPGIGAFPIPDAAAAPVQYTHSDKGSCIRGRLVDTKGRGWYLKLSTRGMYFWSKMPRVKKKKAAFHMAMRTDHAVPTMFTAASAVNNKLRMLDLASYESLEMAQCIDRCGRNTAGRASQGAVMKKFFKDLLDGKLAQLPAPLSQITRENAQWAVNASDGSTLSASSYAGLPDCEWLHLRGHGLGGTEEPANLVAGSHGANTEMAAIEVILQQFSPTMSGLGYRVDVACEPGTLVARTVYMQVVLDQKPVFQHTIDGQRVRYPEIFYKHLQDEVVNRILSGGTRGRAISFTPGGTL